MSEEAGGNQLEDIRVSFTADLTKLDNEIHSFTESLAGKLKPITEEVSKAILGPLDQLLPSFKKILENLDGVKADIGTVSKNIAGAIGEGLIKGVGDAGKAAEEKLKSSVSQMTAELKKLKEARELAELDYRSKGTPDQAALKSLKEMRTELTSLKKTHEELFNDSSASAAWAKQFNKVTDEIDKLQNKLKKLDQTPTGDLSAKLEKFAASARKSTSEVSDAFEKEVRFLESYKRRLVSAAGSPINFGIKEGIESEIRSVDKYLTTATARWEQEISKGIVSRASTVFARGVAENPTATGRADAARAALDVLNRLVQEVPKGMSPTSTIKFRAELETTALKADVDAVVKNIQQLKAGKVLELGDLRQASIELNQIAEQFNRLGDVIQKDTAAAKALGDAFALVDKERSARYAADANEAIKEQSRLATEAAKAQAEEEKHVAALHAEEQKRATEISANEAKRRADIIKAETAEEEAAMKALVDAMVAGFKRAENAALQSFNEMAHEARLMLAGVGNNVTKQDALGHMLMELRELRAEAGEGHAGYNAMGTVIKSLEISYERLGTAIHNTAEQQIRADRLAAERRANRATELAFNDRLAATLANSKPGTVGNMEPTVKREQLELVREELRQMGVEFAHNEELALRVRDSIRAITEQIYQAMNAENRFNEANEAAYQAALARPHNQSDDPLARLRGNVIANTQYTTNASLEADRLARDDAARALNFVQKFNQIQDEFKNVINLPMSSDQRRAQLDELAKRVDLLKTKFGEASTEAKTLDKFMGQIGAQYAGTYREQEREDKQEQVKQERIRRNKEKAAERARKEAFDRGMGEAHIDKTAYGDADPALKRKMLKESEQVLMNLAKEFSDSPILVQKVFNQLKEVTAKLHKVNDEITLKEAEVAGKREMHNQMVAGTPNMDAPMSVPHRPSSVKDSFVTAGLRAKLGEAEQRASSNEDNAELGKEVQRLRGLLFKSRVEDVEGRYKVERAKLLPGQVDEKNKLKDEAVEALMNLRREFNGTEQDAIAFGKKIYKIMAQIAHDTSREIGTVGNEFLDLNAILKRFHDAMMAAGNDQTKQLEAYKNFRGELEALRNTLGGNAEAQQKLINMMIGAAKAIGGLTEGAMKQHVRTLQEQFQLDMQEAHTIADKKKVLDGYIKSLNALDGAYEHVAKGAKEFINKEKAGAERLFMSQVRAQRGDLMNAAMNVGMMTAGAGAIFGQSTDKYAEFSQAMANVNSILKVSRSEIDGLSNSVMAMTSDPHITKGPTDLAKGLYGVVSAGFEGDKALQILEAASKGATAGLTDTKTATQILSSTMSAFKDQNLSARDQMDILFKTVDKGIITFEQLSQHMGPVVQTSAMLNVPMRELGATISVLTRRGLQPAEAFTALNNVMLGLNSPTKEATEEARKLGITWMEAEKAAIHIKEVGLVNTLLELSSATGGSVEKLQLMLPAMREIRGASALLADGGLDLIKMNNSFATSLGATDAALEKQADGFQHHVDKMKSAWEGLLISIGQNNAILGATDALTGLINLMNHMPGVAKGAVGFTAGIAALSGTATTITFFVQSLGHMNEALAKAGGMAGAFGRFGLAVAEASKYLKLFGIAVAGLTIAQAVYDAGTEKEARLTKEWVDEQRKAIETARREEATTQQRVKGLDSLIAATDKAKASTKDNADQTQALTEIMGRLSAIAPDVFLTMKNGALSFDTLSEALHRARNESQGMMNDWDMLAAKRFNLEGLGDSSPLAKAQQQRKDERELLSHAEKLWDLVSKTTGKIDTNFRTTYGGNLVYNQDLSDDVRKLIANPKSEQLLKQFGVRIEDGVYDFGNTIVEQLLKDQPRVVSRESVAERAKKMAFQSINKQTANNDINVKQEELNSFVRQHMDDKDAKKKIQTEAKRLGLPVPDAFRDKASDGPIAQQVKDLKRTMTLPVKQSDITNENTALLMPIAGKTIDQELQRIQRQTKAHSVERNAEIELLRKRWSALVKARFPNYNERMSADSFEEAFNKIEEKFIPYSVDEKDKKKKGSGDRAYASAADALSKAIQSNQDITTMERRALINRLMEMFSAGTPLIALKGNEAQIKEQARSFLRDNLTGGGQSTGLSQDELVSRFRRGLFGNEGGSETYINRDTYTDDKGVVRGTSAMGRVQFNRVAGRQDVWNDLARQAGLTSSESDALRDYDSSAGAAARGKANAWLKAHPGFLQSWQERHLKELLGTADKFAAKHRVPLADQLAKAELADMINQFGEGGADSRAALLTKGGKITAENVLAARRASGRKDQEGRHKQIADAMGKFAPGNASAYKGLAKITDTLSPDEKASMLATINNRFESLRSASTVMSEINANVDDFVAEQSAAGHTVTARQKLLMLRAEHAALSDDDKRQLETDQGDTSYRKTESRMKREADLESLRFATEAGKERIKAERQVKEDRLNVLEEAHKEEMSEFDKETNEKKTAFKADTDEEKAELKKFEDDRAAIRLSKEKVYQESRLKLIEDSEQRILDIHASVAERRAQITGDNAAELLAIEERYVADLNKINVEERLAVNAESDAERKKQIRDNAVENRRLLFLAKEQNRRAKSDNVNEAMTSIFEDWGKGAQTTKSVLQDDMTAMADIMKSTWTIMVNDTDTMWTKIVKIIDGAVSKSSDLLAKLAEKSLEKLIGESVLKETNARIGGGGTAAHSTPPALSFAAKSNGAAQGTAESGAAEHTTAANPSRFIGDTSDLVKEVMDTLNYTEPVEPEGILDEKHDRLPLSPAPAEELPYGKELIHIKNETPPPIVGATQTPGGVPTIGVNLPFNSQQPAPTPPAPPAQPEQPTSGLGTIGQWGLGITGGVMALSGAAKLGVMISGRDTGRQAKIDEAMKKVGDDGTLRSAAMWQGFLEGAQAGAVTGAGIGMIADASTGVAAMGAGTMLGSGIGAAGGAIVGLTNYQGIYDKMLSDSTRRKLDDAGKAGGFIGIDAANNKKMTALNEQLDAWATVLENSEKGSDEYNRAIAGLSTTVKLMDAQIQKTAADTAANNLAIAFAGGGQQYVNAAAEAKYNADKQIAMNELGRLRSKYNEEPTAENQQKIDAQAKVVVDLDSEEKRRKTALQPYANLSKSLQNLELFLAGLTTRKEFAQSGISIEEGRYSELGKAIEDAKLNGTTVNFEGKKNYTVDDAKKDLISIGKKVQNLKNDAYLRSPEFDRDVKKNYYENVSSSNTMNLQQMMGNKRLSLLADANYAVDQMVEAKRTNNLEAQTKASQDFIKSIKDIQNTAFEQATQEFKQAADAATAVASDKLKGIDREITAAERKGQTISTDMVNRRVAATRESIAAQGQLLKTELTRLNLTADEKKKMEAELHSLETDYINAESDARLEAGKKWIDQRMHALDLERQHLDYLKGTSQISEDQAMFSATGTDNMFGPQGIVVRQGALAQAVINEGMSTGNKELQAQGESMYTKAVGEFWDYLSKTQGTMKYTANEEFKKLIGSITVPTAELKAILDPDNADKNAQSWDTATKPVTTYADRVKEIGKSLISLTSLSDPMQKAMSAAFDNITNGSLANMITSLQNAIGLTDNLRSNSTSSGGGTWNSSAAPNLNYNSSTGAINGTYVNSAGQTNTVTTNGGLILVNGRVPGMEYGGVAGYADGGIVRNPFIDGPPNSKDTIPAWLTRGEEVLTAKDPRHIGNLASTFMLMANKIGSMIRHESKSVAITVSGNYLHPDMDMGRFAQQLADELTFKGIL